MTRIISTCLLTLFNRWWCSALLSFSQSHICFEWPCACDEVTVALKTHLLCVSMAAVNKYSRNRKWWITIGLLMEETRITLRPMQSLYRGWWNIYLPDISSWILTFAQFLSDIPVLLTFHLNAPSPFGEIYSYL